MTPGEIMNEARETLMRTLSEDTQRDTSSASTNDTSTEPLPLYLFFPQDAQGI
jgi:hypothetical protein